MTTAHRETHPPATVVCPHCPQLVVRAEVPVVAPPHVLGLDQRQVEILSYVADGLTCAQIGSRFHLAEETIKGHLRLIYRTLGATGRANAVYIALRAGVIR